MKLFENSYFNINSKKTWILLGLCLVSRLLFSIHYIEDIDSMRFYLSILEFDLTKEQPHFPAYPIYIFFVKGIYYLTGSVSNSFAIAGGIAIWLISIFMVRIKDIIYPQLSPYILFIFILFNPLLSLLSTRYMPDLMGLALLIIALYYYLKIKEAPKTTKHSYYLIAIITGVLCGVRLSFVPALLVPFVYFILKDRQYLLRQIILFTITISIWLVPLIYVTGWQNLMVIATKQTHGHFYEFGGTLIVEDSLLERIKKIFTHTWVDGMGFYEYGRHYLVLSSSLLALTIVAIKLRFKINYDIVWITITYALWIFLFQNVVHKSRHILPLIPLVIFLLSISTQRFLTKTHYIMPAFVVVFAALYIYISVILNIQHKTRSAIAQTIPFFKKEKSVSLECPPLLAKYYKIQVPTINILQDSTTNPSYIYSFVGQTPSGYTKVKDTTFYHNEYINRMWATVTIYKYSKNIE